jgi:UDP-N-acetylglucosamine acyltransferase
LIHRLALVGSPPEHRAHIGPGIPPDIDPEARVEAFCTIDAGINGPTRIARGAWLMKGCHVGHDAQIGADVELAPHVVVGGHVTIEAGVRVGLGALFKPYVSVGEGARIGMGAVVICDVPAGEVWAGNPARMIHRAMSDQVSDAEVEGWEQWWRQARA